MSATRLDAALHPATLVAVAVTVGGLAWRPAVPLDQIPPAGIEAPASPSMPPEADARHRQAIVASDIFAATRSAPSVRYDPLRPDGAGDSGLGGSEVGGAGQAGGVARGHRASTVGTWAGARVFRGGFGGPAHP